MRRSTDYMFVLDSYPVSLGEALVSSSGIALVLGMPLGAFFGPIGCAVAIALTCVVLHSAGAVLAGMASLAGEMHVRSGWLVPSDAQRTPRSVPVATALAVSAAIPYAGPLFLTFLIVYSIARVRRHTPSSWFGILCRGCRLASVHLCYPDRSFQLSDGWFGVWTPAASLPSRHFHASWLFAPLWAVVGAWFAAVLVVRGVPWPVQPWIGMASAGLCVLMSPWVVGAMLAETALRMDVQRRPAFECGPTAWERCAELVRLSTHEENGVRLADHVFAGFLQPPHTDIDHPYKTVPPELLPNARPLLKHRSVVEGHALINGKTQSGKSAIEVSGLLTQLVRGVPQPVIGVDGRPAIGIDGEPVRVSGPHVPILVIDMKGDLALLNTTREECARRGQPFHMFTLEQGMQSSYFSAIENFDANGRPTVELTELTANSLSLYWGSKYGNAYYSAQHRDLLLDALHTRPRPKTWAELHERLLTTLDRGKHRDVFELLSKVRVLAEYPHLGAPPVGADTIRMKQVLGEGHCVYFWLPASVAAMSVRDVGKLALYAFLTEARAMATAGIARRAYIFVDEIQCLTGDNLAVVFQQCAGTKVSIVMANQSISDLDADASMKLSQVVRDNVAWRVCFSIHDLQEMERWIRVSGEKCTYMPSYGYSSSTSTNSSGGNSSFSSSVNWQPVVHRRLNEDIIRQVNNCIGGSLVHVDCDGPGGVPLHGIPRRVWTPWPLSKAEYERRSTTPWPRSPVPSGMSDGKSAANTRTHEQVAERALSEFAALDELFLQLRAERRPARTRRAE